MVKISQIAGNAPDDVKAHLADTSMYYRHHLDGVEGPIFGESITKRLIVTEVSVEKNTSEPMKLEGRVVCETTVNEGLPNRIRSSTLR